MRKHRQDMLIVVSCEGGRRGANKTCEKKERSLINSLHRIFPCVLHCFHETTVVRCGSTAPFIAIISISVDSNLVKVKDAGMNKYYHIEGA